MDNGSSKVILHLCADIGSDSYVWAKNGYDVIKVGKNIGVENFNYNGDVYGIIANPPCTEFSTARTHAKFGDLEKGMELVLECLRVIDSCNPRFWVLENPATGKLRTILGEPKYIYQPWWFGSPWTKKTALWGNFKNPKRIYFNWSDVPKNDKLYIKPGRKKPSVVHLHKSAIEHITEFLPFRNFVNTDADFRSLCSQCFAHEFFKANSVQQINLT